MLSRAFRKALKCEMPILFVNIGWAIHYNGTETIIGGHRYIKENPGGKTGEADAFVKRKGYFKCGIGIGRVPTEAVHIMFVARDRSDNCIKIVGLYARAQVSIEENNWAVARTHFAKRFPVELRQPIKAWPNGQGMRRWANRSDGIKHPQLLRAFKEITEGLLKGRNPPTVMFVADEESLIEGEVKQLFVKHRKRESILRRKKITDAMSRNKGRLICEVPRCGFDFQARYGELGLGFAEVHHKKPLSKAPIGGQKTRLADLAIVCANCHRMIHLDGQSRPLTGLIPNAAKRSME
jgi:hypothetical protein